MRSNTSRRKARLAVRRQRGSGARVEVVKNRERRPVLPVEPRRHVVGPLRSNRSADAPRIRVFVEELLDRRDPANRDDVVVVGERDDRRSRRLNAGIASVRHPEPWLPDIAHVVSDRAERVHGSLGFVGRRVVDDDDFVFEIRWDDLMGEVVERARQNRAAVVRADDDRYVWRMGSHHGAGLCNEWTSQQYAVSCLWPAIQLAQMADVALKTVNRRASRRLCCSSARWLSWV